LNISQTRDDTANVVELVRIKVDTEAASYGSEVKYCVCRSAKRHAHACRVAKGVKRHDIGWLEIFKHHLHVTATSVARHGISPFIIHRKRTEPEGHDAQGLHQYVHGRSRAHGVACSESATQRFADLIPILFGNLASTEFIPVFPEISSAAQSLSFEHTDPFRSRIELNCRDVCTTSTHE